MCEGNAVLADEESANEENRVSVKEWIIKFCMNVSLLIDV